MHISLALSWIYKKSDVDWINGAFLRQMQCVVVDQLFISLQICRFGLGEAESESKFVHHVKTFCKLALVPQPIDKIRWADKNYALYGMCLDVIAVSHGIREMCMLAGDTSWWLVVYQSHCFVFNILLYQFFWQKNNHRHNHIVLLHHWNTHISW